MEKDADGSYLYSDRDKVSVLGIITGVTVKTTRNNEQMAFFKLEDRHGEIECICFAKTFKEYGTEIFLDNAIYVDGNISFKDEEQPKIIINSILPLTENESYQSEEKQKRSDETRVND
jgi:DNA polymerase-3 subunit alpha